MTILLDGIWRAIKVCARPWTFHDNICAETPLLMSLTRFVTRHALTCCQPTLRHQNEARETVGLDVTRIDPFPVVRVRADRS